MIRIALYDTNPEECRRLRAVVGRYSTIGGFFNVGIIDGSSYDDFINLIRRSQPGFFNIALIRVSPMADDVIEKLANLLSLFNEMSPRTEVIVLSNNADHALNAYDVGAKFLHMPFDEKEFTRTIGKVMFHASAVDKRPFPIKSGKSVVLINLKDIMFVETARRELLIHLPIGDAIPVKGTLQSLFERLHELDERFQRAGGSFILNIDNVRSTDEESVMLSNGDTLILPVRARKEILEAIEAWGLRTPTPAALR